MLSWFSRKKENGLLRPKDAEQYRYCPRCGGEYRAEFSRCANCDVELVAGPAGSHPSGADHSEPVVATEPLSDHDEVIPIRQGSLAELKRLKALLGRHGLPSVILSDGTDCTRGCCGASSSFLLMIRPTQQTLANRVLTKDYERSTGLINHSWSNAAAVDERSGQLSCPACGTPSAPSLDACPECGLAW